MITPIMPAPEPAHKQRSAVLSLVCLVTAVGIYVNVDRFTGGSWSEYRRLRASDRYRTTPPGPLEFHAPPGAYPTPPGYPHAAPSRGGGGAPAAAPSPERWTLLWPALVYFALSILFAAACCYHFYRAFGPFLIEDDEAHVQDQQG